MPWLIMSDDDPAATHKRADKDLMALHMAYEEAHKDIILAAGSLRNDDGSTPDGGLLLLDVETRAEAEAYYRKDPLTQAGVRGRITIRRWHRSILDGKIHW
ncbi:MULTISPECIES: YciI family protein [Limibacillus]|uniref:YCII-related domain-containing protein n=1 Tax=Limibacillus halophilus TaxID=1579333 RepID=A0A839SYJ8_9PROT|nr:YciI family protein [Limibacillus halophilus]MBB3066694.1 hypothetical protein [Limibacillus halophilus]